MRRDNPLSEILQKTRRVVVKIGTSVLAGEKGFLSPLALSGLAKGIAQIRKKKVEVVLVSSGAIPAGMQSLGYKTRPQKIVDLQACAAVGQPHLIQLYERALRRVRLKAAQLLLTRSDLEDRTRFLNAKHTLAALIERGVVPIINENDTVVTDEIRFGDNDNLAALVTNLVAADLLILLTDQSGLYTSDPRRVENAAPISLIEDVDDEVLSRAGSSTTEWSVGGMQTKLRAARTAAQYGVPTIIASGREEKILQKIFAGETLGTLCLPKRDRLTARKHWIAFTLNSQGRLVVDEGAREALVQKKKSLLPSGVVEISGKFSQGDPVDISDRDGKTFARGLVAYDSSELPRILGKKTNEIETLLGYKGPDEVIHRDDLVIL